MQSPSAQFLFLCTLLSFGERGKCANSSSEDTLSADLWECKRTRKVPVLEVLPGEGWDNLRNLEMGRVLNLAYSCKTTEDGAYIIPDDVTVIPQKKTNLERASEIVDSWKEYKSSTSPSINAQISSMGFINGKFSTDFQNMKTHQFKDHSFTTMVQVRNHLYTVRSSPNPVLDPVFKSRLVEIANYLENNQPRMANYFAETLIPHYGTHVLTRVDAGACLVQEDHVRSSFLQDSLSQKVAIKVSAAAAFGEIINFGAGVGTSSIDAFTKHYIANRTSSRVESIGGVPFYPGITLKTWQESITNRLVAIDRDGQPLQDFINHHTLPDMPEPTVNALQQIVAEAVARYYKVNTYPGCTDATSPNYNFQANSDDKSCDDTVTNVSFGGAYQECAEVSGPDAGEICKSLEFKNPLTGNLSCPHGYAAVELSSQIKEKGISHNECHGEYYWKIFWHQVCDDVFWVSKARFSVHWCVSQGEDQESSGYVFGGLFTSTSMNPLTGSQTCPPSFHQLQLFTDLAVCVSGDNEIGFRYSVPFGGFFSCDKGNPLALSNLFPPMEEQTPLPKTCPAGFSQHLALISEGCEVNYCVKSGIFTGESLPPIRLPPFCNHPIVSATSNSTNEIVHEEDGYWVKDPSTQMWKLVNPAGASTSQSGARLTPVTSAAITASVMIGLAILIALATYGRRRYGNRSKPHVHRRKPDVHRGNPDKENEPLITDINFN